ncbi:MAG: hypothetical protein LH472_03415 [Pyrinomonadaceae bacterium]|nr:hypothetical protein [Pyrinomonadaceae bacterium]
MNSNLWIRKALSTCLVVAILATGSMFALANSERIAGELTISGKNANGETSFVKVNGETAQNGRSIFSSSTIATPENVGAVINLGKSGKIELAPNTILVLSFDEKVISGDLSAGQITVLNSAETVNIKTANGTIATLNSGDSATATGKAQDDDTTGGGGSGWVVWALILGGAAAGIIIAATSDNNRVTVGGGTTVISPTR